MQLLTQPLEHPIQNLALLFLGWKLLLLLVAACNPGPGYDTSTSLALSNYLESRQLPSVLYHVSQRLTRWDGIYFVTIAKRGYLHEQEWAFGWGFTQLITLCTSGLRSLGIPAYDGLESLVAVSIAHATHLASVILLFKLTSSIFRKQPRSNAFVAAALHIISPAGLFLSAPYAESSCAFLTFAGCLNFAKSFGRDGQPSPSRDLLLISSGIMFGAATTFRSNGILNGILLLEEACRLLFRLKDGSKIGTLRRLLAAGLGGLFVGTGFILPQFVAYREYCFEQGESLGKRQWCERAVPSIYTFVQDHYWHCGLFRYWKFSNLPLFLLAAPMNALLILSGLWAWNFDPRTATTIEKRPNYDTSFGLSRMVRSLGVSQLLLVLFTLSTAHVQIITRISSAYPVWLWYVANLSGKGNNAWIFGYVVQFMVMYAVIQGGLFASFLPPA